MDKNEKLALARKKLKKFQAKNSPQPHAQQVKKGGGVRGAQQHSKGRGGPSTSAPSTEHTKSVVVPSGLTPPPVNRMSSAEGLREISQEITSLLSESVALRHTSTPIKPAPLSTASSSSASFVTSLPMLAPPTMTSSLTTAAPLPPPSLGASTTSSMSDLYATANNNQADTLTMFKSGSTASLGSSGLPLPSATEHLDAGGHSLDHPPQLNGHLDHVPGSLGERNDFSNPSLTLLPSLGHRTEGDSRDATPRLLSHSSDSNLLTVVRDRLVPPSDGLMEPHPTVDFQIGTPQYQRSSPAEMEEEVSSLVRDGLSTPAHSSVGVDLHSHHQPSIADSERRELEQKIQAHAQTIDILVSEKSKLQTELTRLQTHTENRKREWEDGQSHLKSIRRSLEETEQSRHLLSEELGHKQKALSQSQTENKKLKENMEKLRAMLEDQQEENTELISKITAQSAEISSVKSANVELQSKLGMAELLNQQLSGDSATQATPTIPDPAQEEELSKVRGEVAQLQSRLQQVTSERDQVNSDLSALRDAMILQQEESTQKVSEAQTKLAMSSALVDSLTEEVENLKREKDALTERVSTEHAQFEHTSQVAVETLQREKDDLESQLDQRITENSQLTKENSELSERSIELEVELSRLKEQSVDHRSLLTTMAQDKETLSRAMSQNKELKANVAELQDAFVRLSNQNMELATELETERHNVTQLKKSLAADQQEAQSPPTPPLLHVSESSVFGRGSGQTTPMLVQTTPISGTEDGGEGEGERSREMADEVKVQEQAKLREQEEQIESLVSERSHLLAQLQALESEHNHSLEECHRVQSQLEELSQQHQELVREREEEEERREEAERQNSSTMDFSAMEEDTVDVRQLSEEQLLLLQSSFKALQRKFVSLMSEKAELLERLQEYEHVIVQLSVETETIGEYITLYQTQRESLKVKFMEKDLFIEQLTNEKAAIQNKLYELQVLLKQLLSERDQNDIENHNIHPKRPTKLSTSAYPLTPSPIHSPTDVPIHIRPVASPNLSLAVEEHELHVSSSFSFTRLHGNEEEEDEREGEREGEMSVRIDGGEMDQHRYHSFSTRSKSLEKEGSREDREDRTATEHGHVTSATAEQIMHLIGQLEMTTSGANRHIAPCACCTGELTVV